MKRGDGTIFWVCNGCGRIPIYNEAEGLFVCPTCDGPLTFNGITAEMMTLQLPTTQSRATFSRVEMPYTLKLLDQETTGLGNFGFRIVTESSVARLRETGWPWPEVDVEFKAEERGVAAEAVNPVAAEEPATGDKPKRKKSEASASALAPEGADAESVADAMAIRFSNKLVNEYSVFGTYAPTSFRVTGPQIPGPDGTVYPELGVAANGSIDAGQQTWPTVEHYYQAMKFPLDAAWQEEIRRAATPMKSKQLGGSPGHPARGEWEKIKEQVMKTALLAKFRQNPALLELLKGTGERRLVEASTADNFWSVGPKGKGLNRLGALLTEVRAELKVERPDKTMLAPVAESGSSDSSGSGSGSGSSGSDSSESTEQSPEETAEAAAAEAEATAADAEVAVKQVGGSGSGSGSGGNGVYLFINSTPMGGIEQKARQARGRGPARSLSWEGMESVSQSGGGGSEQLTTDTGNPVDIKVEKLGS